MKIELLHSTPNYHKLIEAIARVCYQSYDKCSTESHKMIKGIMGKGHLSVASSGNIVFGINTDSLHEYDSVLFDLVRYKEINNYIRWSTSHNKNKESKYDYIVSFNALTLLDIHKNINEYEDKEDFAYSLFNDFLKILKDVPEVYWFIDETANAPKVENPYIPNPSLLNPVILTEDYTYLKDKLTPYELDIHATITVDWITDRATGLQAWRHADQTGGCELSQRYVDRTNAGFRIPSDITDSDDIDGYVSMMEDHINNYVNIREGLHEFRGKKRSQEIARNFLPNVNTRIIQCRPLRQWKHFFGLRDSVHAQREIMEDTQSIKKAFTEVGIKL